MSDTLTPAKYQDEAIKLEALRMYFDFSEGKPTAEKVAAKLGVPVRTIREWFSRELPREALDQVMPLWPNVGQAREFASNRVQAALETVEDVMRHSRSDKMRLDAAIYLLSLAGVRPEESKGVEEAGERVESKPAVLLNLFVGGGGAPRIVDVEARDLGVGGATDRQAPTRLAGSLVEAIESECEAIPISEK